MEWVLYIFLFTQNGFALAQAGFATITDCSYHGEQLKKDLPIRYYCLERTRR